MQKNSITNKITPCCGLPFSVVYWWVSNLTLNSEADRSFILSKIGQSGIISIDGWKVLINSGTLEADASLTKAEFLAWFDCGRQPSCEQLKIIIEGYKMGSWVGDLNEISFVNVLGVLKTTDTAPTTQGLYILSDVGTYTNIGGLVTTAGKINYAYFNGTTWSLIAVEIHEEGIQTHRTEYDDAQITEFFSFIDEIYIIDSEQEQNTSAYTMNYIWINTNIISQRVGKWGFQLMVNGALPTNYGLPNATTADAIDGRLIEIKADNANEPLANRIKVFVKFKSFPTGTIFLQKGFSPFYNQAFIINNFSLLVDFFRPTNTINKAFTEDNKGLWSSLIKNIYINDINLVETDKYSIHYIWLNNAIGKFGLQLYKNSDDPTNYRVTTDLQPNKKYLLDVEAGNLKDSVQVVVETTNFTEFPSNSFLETLPTPIGLNIIDKNAFNIQHTREVLSLFNSNVGAKEIKVSVTENGNNAIQNAINSIETATKESPVNIRVKAGIYKAENSTDYTANGTYPAFILPKDNVNIIGDSAEDCIIWAELPYNDASINRPIARHMHQTIYNWADNSTFENLTIVAKNIRYAVHQDNPNEANKTRYYKNCNFKFLGNKGFLAALGIGTYSGSRTYVEGGVSFSEYTAPFACHNNQKFENPSVWSFKNHTFATVEQNVVINIQNSGSLISDIAHFENCSVEGGLIFNYSDVYIYTPNLNDSYNHANWKITGSGNNPMYFVNEVLGKGLKVEANTVGHRVRFDTNSSAYPLIIANPKNYFGNLGHPERKIQDKYIIHDYYSKLKSYAIGCVSIQEDDYPYGTTTSQDRLGLRLGDCSTVNKTLGIIINDVTYNVVFDKDYTAFTNAQIIAEINAVINGVGVASEYIIGRDYYPEFTDANYKLRNNSSEAILKGTLVSIVGTGVKKATTGDIVLGIAIDDIEPSWKTGEGVYYGFGRIIKKMIFHKEQVLKESGVVIEKNEKYSALSGKLIEDINGNLIGFDDDYLLIP